MREDAASMPKIDALGGACGVGRYLRAVAPLPLVVLVPIVPILRAIELNGVQHRAYDMSADVVQGTLGTPHQVATRLKGAHNEDGTVYLGRQDCGVGHRDDRR